uniref:Uncharacterized protein n=1 Tax=Fagus sylvatica TaxID=28930 RepID=A0A2N9FZV7_FAGSY
MCAILCQSSPIPSWHLSFKWGQFQIASVCREVSLPIPSGSPSFRSDVRLPIVRLPSGSEVRLGQSKIRSFGSDVRLPIPSGSEIGAIKIRSFGSDVRLPIPSGSEEVRSDWGNRKYRRLGSDVRLPIPSGSEEVRSDWGNRKYQVSEVKPGEEDEEEGSEEVADIFIVIAIVSCKGLKLKDKERKAMIYAADIDRLILMSLLPHPRYPSSTIPLD